VVSLVSDGGCTAVPGEYLYVVGEREELGADGVDELVVFSAQIGATDAFGKEGIAGKEHFFVGFVEANAAGRVTRCVQHAEGVVALDHVGSLS